jgi:hypothetical protein
LPFASVISNPMIGRNVLKSRTIIMMTKTGGGAGLTGLIVGDKVGIFEGAELVVGKSEGLVLGSVLGEELGLLEGTSDGIEDGPPDGAPLGSVLGVTLGTLDGAEEMLGKPDGADEGSELTDGFVEGNWLGDSEGDCDGI